MKTRLLALAMAAVLAAFLLLAAGCSSANPGSTDEQFHQGGYSNSDSLRKDQNGAEETGETSIPDIRKIIKNGKLDLEAEDVEKAYASILDYVKQKGGYEFSHQKEVRDDFVSIKAMIKIQPDKLEDVMTYSGNVAKVINSSTTSEDITDKYYDAQTRLQSKRKALEQYYALLNNAKSVNDILAIQSDIDKLTEDMEALEGKLKMWDQLVSESTLTITIHQTNDPLKPKQVVSWSTLSWNDMGTWIKNGFTTVINVLIAVFQWLVIVIASASPLLLLAGIVVVVILLIRRRKRQNQPNTPQPPQTPQPPTHTQHLG